MRHWRRRIDAHFLFEASLLLKLAHSLIEIVSGLALAVMSAATVLSIATFFTENELREDPDDLVANLIVRGAQSLSLGAKGSAVFFLLSHGFVELALVAAIYTGRRWAYPTFMGALALLVGYQTYQLRLSFSGWLAALTVFDIAVIGLTWHEYRDSRLRAGTADRSNRSVP
jgi:uncharacterized membrane protein